MWLSRVSHTCAKASISCAQIRIGQTAGFTGPVGASVKETTDGAKLYIDTQPVRKNIFNVRATYQREAEKAIVHLSSMGITRIALVYADDSFGADGVTGAQKGVGHGKTQTRPA